jgi:hypothetical protein
MARRCRQLCAPHVTPSENTFQALVDPPSHRNAVLDNGGDEFLEGTYGNSLTNAARAGTLRPDRAQHFSFYVDTLKFFMKDFTERTEEHLQDVSGSAMRT